MIPSTRALIEVLKAEGVEGSRLLDIGGGIGAIQHELLDAGVTHATSVEASGAYIDAARAESQRRGHAGRVTYLHGDVVDLADSVAPAEIVTLDRVINVYPEWERLVGVTAARAQRLYGLVHPRNTRMVRLVVSGMNGMLRLKNKPVRAAIRPYDSIERIARKAVSSLTSRRTWVRGTSRSSVAHNTGARGGSRSHEKRAQGRPVMPDLCGRVSRRASARERHLRPPRVPSAGHGGASRYDGGSAYESLLVHHWPAVGSVHGTIRPCDEGSQWFRRSREAAYRVAVGDGLPELDQRLSEELDRVTRMRRRVSPHRVN